MKTFKEVQSELDEEFKDCLVTMEEFLKWWDTGCVSPYDGVGDIHDGNKFITDGFETNIFAFIKNKMSTMTKNKFIKKYPYVAWFNK